MRTKITIFRLFASVTILLTLSCSKEVANDVSQEQDLTVFEKKRAQIQTKVNSITSYNRAPMVYISELCGDIMPGVHTGGNNTIFDPAAWDCYYFNGNVGDVISIYIPRMTGEFDPAFSLFEGTTTSTDGVNVFEGGPDMTYLAFHDDEVPNPLALCFIDPELASFELPSTGTYTLAVFDSDGCGAPLEYEIHTIGIGCNAGTDTDGDGCLDGDDPHPESNVEPTVVIDGCDSQVPNLFVTDCSTMSDLIADCADAAGNQGAFISCVVHLLRDWKREGLITNRQRVRILICAIRSGIPSS